MGFGTGKTILEQSIAKFADVDIVVYVGCGERGNEMAELIEEFELLKDPWSKKRLMERTFSTIKKILDFHEDAAGQLKQGVVLDEIIAKKGY